MRIHPKEELETIPNWNSQRQLTELGSQYGNQSMQRNLLQPSPQNKYLFKAKTVKNFIQLSTVSTMSPPMSLRMESRKKFSKMVRAIINSLHFIEELKNYAEQLKSQNVKYQYRKRNWFPLFPDDPIYICWGLFIHLCTNIAAILFPLQIAFQFENLTYQFILLLQIIFFIDIIMNFICCHINKQLNLIYELQSIAYFYLNGWFIIDFISIFPDISWLQLLKLFRLLKFFFYERRISYNQSVDLLKKEKAIKEELVYRNELYFDLRIKKLFKIFLEMIVLNHLFACLWYWSCQFSNEHNWLQKNDLKDSNTITQYLSAYYWAYQTITVIGYGDIEAQNFFEYLLSILWMLVGVFYYSFTIGNITFILIQSNPNQECDDQIMNLEEISSNMPDNIETELFKFAQFNILRNPFWTDDSKRILSELPQQLQLYLIASVHKDVLRTIPFMSNDINFSASVLPYSTLVYYSQYETIYHIGQYANDFFFLIQGDVRLCDSNGEAIISVMEGTCFGEIESIEQTQRQWSAHALSQSLVLMCSANFFSQYLQQDSPQFFELQQLYKRRKIVLYQQAKLKRLLMNKIRRGHAIDEQHYLNRKNTLAQQLENFKAKVDLRPYLSVQQDLMLQIVGQRQARKKIIREKFANAIQKVLYLVQRSRNKKLNVQDSDYRIIHQLINTRSSISSWSRSRQKKFGRRLLSNFKMVCDSEEQIKQFLLKSKQESIERIMRKKFIHLIRNICSLKKHSKKDTAKIDCFYSKFHQQIYEEVKQEKMEEKKRIKQKSEMAKQQIKLKSKFNSLSSSLKQLEKLSVNLSMTLFEINNYEYEIDTLITDLKQQLISINT